MNSLYTDKTLLTNANQDWQISDIVQQLHDVRNALLVARDRQHRPPKLPSRKALISIVDGLVAALFPNRMGRPELTNEGIDFFVGHTLDTQLRALYQEVCRELQFISGLDHLATDDAINADGIIRQFAAQLPTLRLLLETDIQAAFDGDPAARAVDEILVCYPGVIAIIYHRLAHVLFTAGAPLVARIIAEIAHSQTGIDIHPGARIGERFFIDHGTGVVIGETTIIGRNVRIYQAVTLGAKRFPVDKHGALLKGGDRHPIVEDNVVIYAGATILGRITIGAGSSIGGNVWLTRSVPAQSNISQANHTNEHTPELTSQPQGECRHGD